MDEQTKQQYDEFRRAIDTTSFAAPPYSRRVTKPWGYEIHFTPDNLPYMGKILHIDEGKRLSLQVHDKKQESWWLAGGQAVMQLENERGELEEINMEQGKGYNMALGQKHRLVGGTGGGDVFEVSTPEDGNTYHLEDDYARDTETEESRQERNRETQK